MNTNIFIPEKLKVGYQKRSDTYTGQLAYVIYFDKKGVLRKETSWENWRDKTITPIEYKNEPLEGFVLNKNVGGYKSDWNFRSAYCRVYDPRGFEIEISIQNLLYILENTSSIKGKGLEGKFIYGWFGKDLVLLPEDCPEFAEMQKFSNLQTEKVSKKDLIPGWKYLTKKNEVSTYLGFYPEYTRINFEFDNPQEYLGDKYWFCQGSCVFYTKSSLNFLATKLEEDKEYPFLMDKVERTSNFSKVDTTKVSTTEVKVEDLELSKPFFVQTQDGVFHYVDYCWSDKIEDSYSYYKFNSLEDIINKKPVYRPQKLILDNAKFFIIKHLSENGKEIDR